MHNRSILSNESRIKVKSGYKKKAKINGLCFIIDIKLEEVNYNWSLFSFPVKIF